MPSSLTKRAGAVVVAIVLCIVASVTAVAALRHEAQPALLPASGCGTYTGKGCGPNSARVDLARPTFSHPTKITNPLFPISTIDSVVLLGHVEGKPFRSETTLRPYRTTVDWDGEHVEVLMSQYLAYVDGQIEEMALDRYAQADDGSVWYFGEDVFDYVDGQIAVSEGTWLAGRGGPPAMIMPAHPKPGDVFRAENITGVVFEELRVNEVDLAVHGPSGKVQGAVTMDELHVDGVTLSGKTFAPGYGEFLTTDGDDIEAAAVAHGTDTRDGPMPAALGNLVTRAWGVLESIRLEDWPAAQNTAHRMATDWASLKEHHLPPRVADEMDRAIAQLGPAVDAKKAHVGVTATIAVAQSATDLELLYRQPIDIDIERVHLHAQRLRVDAAADDSAGVSGEVSVLGWVAERIRGHLAETDRRQLDSRISDLRVTNATGDVAATGDAAARLAAWLRGSVHPR
jgi:hypothetical protein